MPTRSSHRRSRATSFLLSFVLVTSGLAASPAVPAVDLPPDAPPVPYGPGLYRTTAVDNGDSTWTVTATASVNGPQSIISAKRSKRTRPRSFNSVASCRMP